MTFPALLKCLPSDLRITLADVGSAGGLHRRWSPVARHVGALLFEPREGGARREADGNIIHPFALGHAPGRATLHVTALENMSSTLAPNAALLDSFYKKGADVRIVRTCEMAVDTLDAVAKRDGARIDLLKVDTQGSELSILRGAEACLASTIVLSEIEVSFFPRYEGQALIGDIIGFMVERGFELIELSRIKRYRRRNSFGIRNIGLGGGGRAGRIAYGDAIFFLREAVLLDRLRKMAPAEARHTALAALLALIVYGKADMAAALFEQCRNIIGPPYESRLDHWFAALGKRRLRSQLAHKVVDYLARHV